MAASGCLGCHRVGENGNSGPGPDLTEIGRRLPAPGDRSARWMNPTSPMPSYRKLEQQNPKEFKNLVNFLASLKGSD